METNLIWEDCENNFGSWKHVIEPIFPLLTPIYERLKFDTNRKKKILPLDVDVFRALRETEFSNLRVVICGIGPYHTITKEKNIIADGIALSCGRTGVEQPSLTQWWNAMEREYPEKNIYRNPNLQFLCNNGILMFNTSLTVEYNKPLSHNELWKEFIKEFFSQIIANTGVPIITLGAEAKWIEKTTAPFQWIFNISHPASASYAQTDWNSEGVFKKVSQIVKDRTGEELIWFEENAPF